MAVGPSVQTVLNISHIIIIIIIMHLRSIMPIYGFMAYWTLDPLLLFRSSLYYL